MGGGKSRSSSSNSQSDNDIVVDGLGNTALGEGARLDQSDKSNHLGIGSKQLTGSAKDLSKNEGFIMDGGQLNTGTQVEIGHGSTYIDNSMDQNTADLLDTAFAVVSSTNENVFELAAARDGVKPTIHTAKPEAATQETAATSSKGWKSVLFVAALIGLYLARRKK